MKGHIDLKNVVISKPDIVARPILNPFFSLLLMLEEQRG